MEVYERAYEASSLSKTAVQLILTSVNFGLSIVLWPITGVGIAAICLRIWVGENPKVRDMFAFFPPSRLPKSWAMALILEAAALQLIPMFVMIITAYLTRNDPTGINAILAPDYAQEAYLVTNLIIQPFAIWFGYRLYLIPYILARHPEMSVGAIPHNSWRSMKGYCGRAFAMDIHFLYVYVPLLLLLVLLAAPFAQTVSTIIDYTVIGRGYGVFIGLFFRGYIMISHAGLSDTIMHKSLDPIFRTLSDC